MLDGWLGGMLVRCCDVSGTMVTLVDEDGVLGSGGGWLDVTDVVVVGKGLAHISHPGATLLENQLQFRSSCWLCPH